MIENLLEVKKIINRHLINLELPKCRLNFELKRYKNYYLKANSDYQGVLLENIECSSEIWSYPKEEILKFYKLKAQIYSKNKINIQIEKMIEFDNALVLKKFEFEYRNDK